MLIWRLSSLLLDLVELEPILIPIITQILTVVIVMPIQSSIPIQMSIKITILPTKILQILENSHPIITQSKKVYLLNDSNTNPHLDY